MEPPCMTGHWWEVICFVFIEGEFSSGHEWMASYYRVSLVCIRGVKNFGCELRERLGLLSVCEGAILAEDISLT